MKARTIAVVALVSAALSAAVLGAGCVGDSPDKSVDAGSEATVEAASDVAAATDAPDGTSAACDLSKDFGPPSLVPGVIDSPSHDDGFWLLPDELTVFTSGDRSLDGSVGDFDIMTGVRANTATPFSSLSIVAVSTTYPDRSPVVTGDGRRGYLPQEIWVATRSSALVPFAAAQKADAPLNAATHNQVNWVSQDGTTLYGASREGTGDWNIWRTTKQTAGFAAPTLVASLNSPSNDTAVVLTPDERQAFFASNRPGGMGVDDIYYATRADSNAGFSTPVPLTSINSALAEYPSWVSPDGCRLYFSSRDREGGLGNYDVYVTSRPK
jgi:hypothetical protein